MDGSETIELVVDIVTCDESRVLLFSVVHQLEGIMDSHRRTWTRLWVARWWEGNFRPAALQVSIF